MRVRIWILASTALTAMIGAPGNAASMEPAASDEIVVTASPLGRSENETIIGTAVVSGDALKRNLANSIGETLRRQPGISSSYFGPGASRPVIRGLGGDRIRVLDSGIGSIDASATSPDHAVAVEPATAEKIEIVRGVATLLYGSAAAGGVINVFDGRIPFKLPGDADQDGDGVNIDGALRISGSTVDGGVEAAGGFDARLIGLGDGALVFHGDGFYRNAENYRIPNFAESAILRAAEEAGGLDAHEEEEAAFGVSENSRLETNGGSSGLSYVFSNGFFGLSGTAIDTAYGVPGGHGHDEEARRDEGGVTIELRQRRLDMNGEIDADFLLFKNVKLRAGYADYLHTEIEPSGEPGTVFANEGWEGRLELVEKTRPLLSGLLSGAVGFQYRKRDFSAVGDEAFVPPTTSRQFGVFAIKELETGSWRFELGGRYEKTTHRLADNGGDRSFAAFSVVGGIGLKPFDAIFLGVTGFRTERAPATEELFSNGPHLATNAFEIGDPDFGVETARGIEATAKIGNDVTAFTINGFYTSYKDFIFEVPTGGDAGGEAGGLTVFQFGAADAAFRGFEAALKAEVAQIGVFDIHGDIAIDYVRATAGTDGDQNLPRIPPLSGLFGVEAKSATLDLRVEVEYASRQNKIAVSELPTAGYTLFNAYLTYRILPERTGISIRLAATNLTNSDARLHTSFLKDVAPLPGRNIKLSLLGEF